MGLKKIFVMFLRITGWTPYIIVFLLRHFHRFTECTHQFKMSNQISELFTIQY